VDMAIDKISEVHRETIIVYTVLTGLSDCSESAMPWCIQRTSNRTSNGSYRASSGMTRFRVPFVVGERAFDRRCNGRAECICRCLFGRACHR
jgi:hypothetical protein